MIKLATSYVMKQMKIIMKLAELHMLLYRNILELYACVPYVATYAAI